MSKKRSRLQRDIDEADNVENLLRQHRGIDVGAPVSPDTRLKNLVATASEAVGRFMPPIPVIAKVAPAMAVASDHHESTIGEAVGYDDDVDDDIVVVISKPNRKQASETMRHRRVH